MTPSDTETPAPGLKSAPRGWLWSVALVVALLVATAPGTWLLTDQAYAIAVARNLAEGGGFILAGPDATSVPDLPWLKPGSRGDFRAQIHPLVPVLLAPLARLDSALGLWSGGLRGGTVHWFNLACIALALWLMGRGVAEATGQAAAATLAVLSTGLLWSTHLAARHGMAEPLMILLLAAFATSETRLGAPGRWAALGLLPWTHPVGIVLSVVLAVAGPWSRRRWIDRADLCVSAASIGLFMAAWNYGLHGHWLKGGYADLEPRGGAFFAIAPWTGLWLQVREIATMTPLVPLLVALAWLTTRDRGRLARQLTPGLAALAAILALFSTHYFMRVYGEPTRHLSVVWPLLGTELALGWPAEVWPRRTVLGLLGAQALLSLDLFFVFDGRYYPGPGGLYYPSVIWVKAAIDGRYALAAVGLAALGFAVVAGVQTWRLLLRPKVAGP